MVSDEAGDTVQAASARVRAALRAAILKRRHLPGEVLSRGDIARALGVSQTPVREALDRMAAEGFVTVRPRSGTVVAPIDVTALFEGHYLAVALLSEAVRSLAGLGVADGPKAALDEPDTFRRALLAGVGMGRLWDGLGAYFGALERCRALDRDAPNEPRAMREDVLGRIEAGDAPGAVASVRALLADDLAPLPRWRAAHPEVFA